MLSDRIIDAAETTETDTIEEEEETMTYSVYTDIWGICRENVSLEKAREVAEIYQGEGRDWEIRDDDTGEVIESYYKEDEEE